ncbi:hypothetical protein ABENE_16445 [Asticcacaulis benevestitus DSM 16100 = ATCC BAA-896]|uniref:Uncharacterized protein n=1 Tax=Asticcacaulis benevestitus DSM 16100 = ATCC BAA-896 TaxID=1121022 RepID=V4R9N0_9CAUL|nr:hypothetical protein ABENE_16445 [Asticcacaulis benevestitus DSM 16100 = ATCC BAA-896]
MVQTINIGALHFARIIIQAINVRIVRRVGYSGGKCTTVRKLLFQIRAIVISTSQICGPLAKSCLPTKKVIGLSIFAIWKKISVIVRVNRKGRAFGSGRM